MREKTHPTANRPFRKKRRDPPPAATVLMSSCGDWRVTPAVTVSKTCSNTPAKRDTSGPCHVTHEAARYGTVRQHVQEVKHFTHLPLFCWRNDRTRSDRSRARPREGTRTTWLREKNTTEGAFEGEGRGGERCKQRSGRRDLKVAALTYCCFCRRGGVTHRLRYHPCQSRSRPAFSPSRRSRYRSWSPRSPRRRRPGRRGWRGCRGTCPRGSSRRRSA